MMSIHSRSRDLFKSVTRFSLLAATGILLTACGGDIFQPQADKAAEVVVATPQTWQAMSRTATGITGDITVTPSKLIFQNGASINIQRVDQNAEQGITLYQVTSKNNPVLLHGNLLCGQAPVDYLTLEKVGSGRSVDLSLSIYYYPGELRLADLPLQDQSSTTRTLCAIYNYVQ